MTPRLSVIIPVRNGADFVGRAIASAQAIPVAPLEILLVDDGSTDGTPELLHAIAAADARLVVIRRDRDHGASAARNEGVAKARADIVVFLDADDVLYADPIGDRLVWHEAHGEIALSFTNYETLLPDGVVEPRFAGYTPRFQTFLAGREGMVELGDRAFALLYGENPVCTTGTMARRDALLALGGFARDLRQAEDWDLWIRFARGHGVAYSTTMGAPPPAPRDSLSTDVADRTEHIARVVRRHLAFALRKDIPTALAALSAVEIAEAELARMRGRNVVAWRRYLAGFLLLPSLRLGRDFARATAVLVGLRSGRIESFEDRARLAVSKG